ncbi:urokinase plasminogen activator surface receptor-like [Megalobrama amblycephala]|uniref:urokinase plasminogen activator surface receptor-like n=1 Tax=Megalobrama amblycephala TaxID=75352 RepID=UPI0020144B99|nr:urokinase plasminogen activator surface receptor-like [Megalobrama amblycephala]
MDLQISVFLLFILFTAGHSRRCYECTSLTGSCADQRLKTCPSESSQCSSVTSVVQVGDIRSKVKVKDCAPACQSGSLNIGSIKATISCCNSDECNLEDAPDPSTATNGKTCYTCDGQNCTTILSCLETEDRCINATVTSGGQSVSVKGCASKSVCDATTSVAGFGSISCCNGNLCNGAPSVSQSFLFLCCSLLSYFLLH